MLIIVFLFIVSIKSMSWFRAKMRFALYLPSFALAGALVGMALEARSLRVIGLDADGLSLGAAIGALGGLIAILFGDSLSLLLTRRGLQERINEAVLEIVDRPVVILRSDCSVVVGNRRFCDMAGVTLNELQGLSFKNIEWHDKDGRALDSTPWSRVAETGVEFAREQVVFPVFGEAHQLESRADRSTVAESSRRPRQPSFYVTCQPLRDARGGLTGLFVTFEPSLQSAVNSLNYKPVGQETLLKLSHEIRSPISALLGHADWLRNEPSIRDDQQQKQLDIIHDSGTQVLELVSRILDRADFGTETKQVRFEDCSPFLILEGIKQLFALEAAKKGLQLSLVIRGELPCVIRSEAVGLRQLLTNLIENAIKFTDVGGVVIQAQMVTRCHAEYLEISVVDSGVGIPREQLEKIFQPFVQADKEQGGLKQGVGLGLAICQELAERLGAKIDVRSEEGFGSEFTLQLEPRIPAWTTRLTHRGFFESQSEESVNEKKIPSQSLSGKKILVVDDDPSHRKLFSLYLERMGAVSYCVQRGEEAIELVRKERVDLVLMDIQMPGSSGCETLVALREAGFETPVIAVTACVESLLQCTEGSFAFAGWVRKPINPIDLEGMIGGCVGFATSSDVPLVQHHQIRHSAHSVKHRPRSPKRSFAKVPSVKGSMEAWSPQAVHSSLPTREPEFAEIVSLFLKTLHRKLDEINHNPLDCDFEQLQQFAHWLKGTSASCGFRDFLLPALELEKAILTGQRESSMERIRDIQNLAEAVALPALA